MNLGMGTERERRMNEFDVSAESVDGTVVERSREMAEQARKYAPTVARSGAVEGLSGAVTLVRGLRSLYRGETGRGLVRLLVGGLFLALAATRRRSVDRLLDGHGDSDVDQRDVADTSTDIGDLDTETDADTDGSEREGEPADVVDPSVDVEDTGPSPELDSDVDETDVDQRDVVETGVDDESIEEAEDESDPENVDASE